MACSKSMSPANPGQAGAVDYASPHANASNGAGLRVAAYIVTGLCLTLILLGGICVVGERWKLANFVGPGLLVLLATGPTVLAGFVVGLMAVATEVREPAAQDRLKRSGVVCLVATLALSVFACVGVIAGLRAATASHPPGAADVSVANQSDGPVTNVYFEQRWQTWTVGDLAAGESRGLDYSPAGGAVTLYWTNADGSEAAVKVASHIDDDSVWGHPPTFTIRGPSEATWD